MWIYNIFQDNQEKIFLKKLKLYLDFNREKITNYIDHLAYSNDLYFDLKNKLMEINEIPEEKDDFIINLERGQKKKKKKKCFWKFLQKRITLVL